jgi:glycosyltransferase involved in cell wall biosynthesis
MKIIIGTESFAPNISGVAVATELLAENLAKAGHAVFVFAPSGDFKDHLDSEYKEYKVYRFKSIENPFRKNFRVAFLPKQSVYKLLAEIKPDIIHLQDPAAISNALLKSARRMNIPIIVTNHFTLDYITSYLRYLKPFHPIIKWGFRRYLSNFYNKCNEVTCPTETVKKELLKWRVKKPVTAISNGVDLDRFYNYLGIIDIFFKYHLPRNPIVLYAGRIDKDKNLAVLINAIPEVLGQVEAHFVLAGSGDKVEQMKELSKELGVDHAVSFIGWIDRESEDLQKIYQVASVFAIASPLETQSIVTMEAMASGLPIVAANSGALPELVKNDQNGFLFKAGDSADMAKKITDILLDKKMRIRMKKKSLEFISSHQIEISFNKLLEVYYRVLKNHQK